jgi:hypothetical protein
MGVKPFWKSVLIHVIHVPCMNENQSRPLQGSPDAKRQLLCRMNQLRLSSDLFHHALPHTIALLK